MKIHTDFAQKSDTWLWAKAGIVTASEAESLFTPKFKIKVGGAVETLLNVKLAEWWTGRPLDGFSSFAMDNGTILEDEAKPYYEISYGQTVQSVGLVTDETDGQPATIGCSPDGLIGEDGGLEIKCPNADTHVEYLRAGTVPDDYLPQVHFSLYVTERAWWDFFSYRRKFPPVRVRVLRDEKIMHTIGMGLELFMEDFAKGKATLIDKNGGVRPTPAPRPVTPAEYLKNNPDPEVRDGRH